MDVLSRRVSIDYRGSHPDCRWPGGRCSRAFATREQQDQDSAPDPPLGDRVHAFLRFGLSHGEGRHGRVA